MAKVTGGALSGTFYANETSNSIYTRAGGVMTLKFGAGTVTLRRKNLAGTFVPTGDVYTADTVAFFSAPGEYDLVCTDHSSDITYEIEPA